MKPTPILPIDLTPLLAFGAHPDDIEFGCGGVIAAETIAGRAAHLIVCSRGESASFGTPQQRSLEAEAAAAILGATLEFVELDGDSHLQAKPAHAITLAGILRRLRPGVVLAPSPMENQHPDHVRLGQLVRDACRLARYGGIAELRGQEPHRIGQLLFYDVTGQGEPGAASVLVDVSDPAVMDAWKRAMQAHASQTQSGKYVEMQLARARVNGLLAGVEHAIELCPNEPLVLDRLARLGRGARRF
jgi:LmbE family N-acetylglucosaminyl deacetylase